MKVTKLLVFMVAIAISMATLITIITLQMDTSSTIQLHAAQKEPKVAVTNIPSIRISRFLKAIEPQKRSDHCKKDKDVCGLIMPLTGGRNSTCCNSKCVDLHYDSYNCGACKKKCYPWESCCRGECVNLSYDKRHCGSCNNRCMPEGYCIYGTCDYA